MKTLLALVAIFSVTGCARDRDETTLPAALPAHSPEETGEQVVHMTLGYSDVPIKHPHVKGSAERSYDAESCRLAGGEWSPIIIMGKLSSRQAEPGAARSGRTCTFRTPTTKLSDAGKRCAAQSDCVGNCRSEKLTDGTWALPSCQAFAEESLCGRQIYDEGEYHFVRCREP
jgi:hypothetical protein